MGRGVFRSAAVKQMAQARKNLGEIRVKETNTGVWDGRTDVKPRAPRRRRWFLGSSIVVLLAGLSSACGGSGAGLPVPTLAQGVSAQRAFRPISTEWLGGTPAERARLEPKLRVFIRDFSSDPLTRLAKTWLGWIALDRGELARADAWVRDARTGPEGTTRDLATVVYGATERRRGHPQRALEVLAPFSGKLIDAYVRLLLDEEVVLAALEAGRADEAVRLMAVWLREAPEDELELVRAKITAMMRTVPEAKLLALLEGPKSGGADAALLALAAQRLAELVESRRDAALAQRLLTVAGSLLGDHAETVAKLASATQVARVETRTVGLLISSDPGDPGATRRGAEVAAGLARGLGLPGSGARLIVREAGAHHPVDEALLGFVTDGAALIVAGLNDQQVLAAAAFGAEHQTPVVLIRPPTTGPTLASRFVFVVGDDVAETAALLRAALVARGSPSVLEVREEPVADTTISCDLPVGIRSGSGVILQGGPDCAARVFSLLAAQRLRPQVALGLESVGLSAPAGTLRGTAGEFSKGASATTEDYREWMHERGRPPTWFEALGHDVGALASQAMRSLPADDPAPTAARRSALTEAFSRASAALWTTQARGFEGDRTLPRQIAVAEQP
jgi:hypothetical protein